MSYAATFLTGANADFIAGLYARYRHDPASIDPSWSGFFNALGDDERAILSELRGASWNKLPAAGLTTAAPANANRKDANGSAAGELPHTEDVRQATLDSIRALMLIRAYRIRGHLMAKLDPLHLQAPGYHPELDPKNFGFTEADYDRPIFIDNVLGFERATLRQILDTVQRTYCGSIGVEYMHIQNPEHKQWIQERMENTKADFSPEERKQFLARITAAEGLEKLLALKKPGTKRFGLEGGETLIPAIEQIITRGAELGLREVVIGMAHRGRLNVLTNVLNKPFTALFSEFQGNSAYPDSVQGSGDVKYHLGTSGDREFAGQMVHLTMNPNPSHLEAVDPVVVGRVRAKQQQRNAGNPNLTDAARSQVMGLLLHGDAAFAGQGVVAETLMLSELKGYTTGGTLHIIINNQIGFTTTPSYSRSGPYCTDVAKMIQAPIFHVNGDDPDAAMHVARIAIEFRQRFSHDVVVDMFCYRRHGHNEGDEPAFTQPLMYKAINAQPTTRAIYAQRLADEGVASLAESDKMNSDFIAKLDADYKASEGYKPNKADWLEGKWSGLEAAPVNEQPTNGKTGVALASLQDIGRALSSVPEGWDINPKIVRQLQAKAEMLKSGEGFDWATAEAMAFATLCAEGYPVRLSGQDSGRGTFSQRHSVLHDQTNEKRYLPINHVHPGQAVFEVHDSPLSEAAVLGFEYGFSTTEPRALVLWEAQFGDFANGAQVYIDQFIAAGESKWLRMSGLVLLLPHGYEGQGAEHSSARLERCLQLCAENNLQVANCTTPANYFHILRRQMHRAIRKPLILMTPKSLLRHKLCVSSLKDFTDGTAFRNVIPEHEAFDNKKVRRVVLCSGKVYYDLLEARIAKNIRDVAIIRVEELYPFPAKALGEQLALYPKADIVWCQEEPDNMGAWQFIDRRIERVLTEIKHSSKRPVYIGRPECAAPANGLLRRHNEEQARLVEQALAP